jgi:regulator of RNase E activity RraB
MRLKLDGDNAEPAIRLYDRNDVVRAMLKLSKDGTAIFEPFDTEANEIQGSDGTGVLIARLLEDESLPKEIRDAIFDAAEKIMNELNEGDEMTVAWTKLYLDEALKRRREEETDDEG